MLDDDVLDALRHNGSSIVEFDSLDIAHTVFQQIEDATEAVANIDLYVVIYANGHSWLSIDQHSEVPHIAPEFATTTAMKFLQLTEHPSELQSLTHNSYALFCLKK